jgi:hypothetical protein
MVLCREAPCELPQPTFKGTTPMAAKKKGKKKATKKAAKKGRKKA